MTSPTLIDAMRQVSALLQAGNFRVAHDRLVEISRDHPDSVEVLRLLAGTMQALGDVDGAEALLRRALELDPTWTPTLTTLAELLLASGRAEEAESLLRRAVCGSPPFPRAAFVLARYCNDLKRPEQALEIAGAAIAAGNFDPELVTQHVAALAALGRSGEAVAGYRHIVGASPGNLAAAHALAIALDTANQPAEAAAVAERALARGHSSPALLFTQARSLVALRAFDRAESALQECVRREPRLIDAHSHLARLIWMRSGDAALATASFDAALQKFAGDDALSAAKAAVLQGAGDARGAYSCLESKAARPQAAPALLVRAGLAALEFDPATARSLAERALRVMPADVAARKLLVAALLGVGDARAALPLCEALLAESPDDQYLIALQTVAWRLLDDTRYEPMCDYANLAVPFHLQAPEGWKDLGAFFADLVRSLDRLHDPRGHPLLFQSLRHGTETTDDLARSADPVIRELFRSFDAPIREYMARIGGGEDPLRRRNRGSYRFNGGWSVRLRSAGFHNSHVHPRGWISSACYVELPDAKTDATDHAGALVFGQPSIITTPPLGNEHVIRPEVGMLVLFPSYFWHGTVPFVSAQSRLTVAFDAVPDR